jgi:hypothetical protein
LQCHRGDAIFTYGTIGDVGADGFDPKELTALFAAVISFSFLGESKLVRHAPYSRKFFGDIRNSNDGRSSISMSGDSEPRSKR